MIQSISEGFPQEVVLGFTCRSELVQDHLIAVEVQYNGLKSLREWHYCEFTCKFLNTTRPGIHKVKTSTKIKEIYIHAMKTKVHAYCQEMGRRRKSEE